MSLIGLRITCMIYQQLFMLFGPKEVKRIHLCDFWSEDNQPLTLARLALVKALAMVIASGLELMGIEPVQEMR